MKISTRKSISLLMLGIFFLMSLNAYGFNSQWLGHELDHDRQAVLTLADHHHPLLVEHSNPDHEPLSPTEHQLLHAAADLHSPFISSRFDTCCKDLFTQTALSLPSLLISAQAGVERLFRPPRTSSHP